MKSLIQMALVALIVGGASAGGSFYWQLKYAKAAKPEATAEKTDKDPEHSTEEKTDTDEESKLEVAVDNDPVPPQEDLLPDLTNDRALQNTFGPPVAIRPPYDQHGDEAGDLINRLRARAASTSRQEARLSEREEAMQLIFEDLRVEQVNSANLRKKVLDEINRNVKEIGASRKATETERAAIQKRQVDERRQNVAQIDRMRIDNDEALDALRREKDEELQSAANDLKSAQELQEDLRKQIDDLKKPPVVKDLSGTPEATVNLKKMIAVVDTLPPEDTAKILEEMVQKGRTEAVVAILNAMKPRQSAKVLTAITEKQPALAADLMERLKRFKKDDAAPPQQPPN